MCLPLEYEMKRVSDMNLIERIAEWVAVKSPRLQFASHLAKL